MLVTNKTDCCPLFYETCIVLRSMNERIMSKVHPMVRDNYAV